METARAQVTVSRSAVESFAYATGDQPGRARTAEGQACAPLAMAFALAWEPMFAALSGALPDVTRLVHEEPLVAAGPAFPASQAPPPYAAPAITGNATALA